MIYITDELQSILRQKFLGNMTQLGQEDEKK